MKSLREQIKSHYVTQREFAEYCGVSLRTVERWCAENTIPRVAELAFEVLEIMEKGVNRGAE